MNRPIATRTTMGMGAFPNDLASEILNPKDMVKENL